MGVAFAKIVLRRRMVDEGRLLFCFCSSHDTSYSVALWEEYVHFHLPFDIVHFYCADVSRLLKLPSFVQQPAQAWEAGWAAYKAINASHRPPCMR